MEMLPLTFSGCVSLLITRQINKLEAGSGEAKRGRCVQKIEKRKKKLE